MIDFKTFSLENEQWKPIKDFNGYYISNFGRVLGKKKTIMKSKTNNSGYLKINLYKDKKSFTKTVHRLVALHFIENPNNYKEVNHKDGNKLNNKVNNLEWCTRSDNNKHALRTGLRQNPNPKKMTLKQEEEARSLYKHGWTQEELAQRYSINISSLRYVLKGIYKNKPIPQNIKKIIREYYLTGKYTYKQLSNLFNVGEGSIGRALK